MCVGKFTLPACLPPACLPVYCLPACLLACLLTKTKMLFSVDFQSVNSAWRFVFVCFRFSLNKFQIHVARITSANN